MTAEQLKTIEAELHKRGYKKWTTALTSSEDWAWFKTFGKKQDEDGEVTHGYQIAFRVWDGSKYPGCPKEHPYGFDFWTSGLGTDSRIDFTSSWEPSAGGAWIGEEGTKVLMELLGLPKLTWDDEPYKFTILKTKRNGNS